MYVTTPKTREINLYYNFMKILKNESKDLLYFIHIKKNKYSFREIFF